MEQKIHSSRLRFSFTNLLVSHKLGYNLHMFVTRKLFLSRVFQNHKSQSEKLRIQRRSRDEKETLSLVDAWGHSFHQIACIYLFFISHVIKSNIINNLHRSLFQIVLHSGHLYSFLCHISILL